MTTVLPNSVSRRNCQLSTILFRFSILSSKLSNGEVPSSVENHTPSALTFRLAQVSFLCGKRVWLLSRDFPVQRASVFP